MAFLALFRANFWKNGQKDTPFFDNFPKEINRIANFGTSSYRAPIKITYTPPAFFLHLFLKYYFLLLFCIQGGLKSTTYFSKILIFGALRAPLWNFHIFLRPKKGGKIFFFSKKVVKIGFFPITSKFWWKGV